MSIKKSAKLFIAFAVSAVGLLAFSSITINPIIKQTKPGRQLTETELFSPWSMVSKSILRTKA